MFTLAQKYSNNTAESRELGPQTLELLANSNQKHFLLFLPLMQPRGVSSILLLGLSYQDSPEQYIHIFLTYKVD